MKDFVISDQGWMETFPKCKEPTRALCKIGDQLTSDVVVRLRTQEGRDDRFYCHSHILTGQSKYFAERLSENWPTCQILDSRNCVEVYCHEAEFNHHVTALRLLYVTDRSLPTTWHGVRNALGILQVAVHLGCCQMARACVEYLEAVPWEESEEEEILRVIPAVGSLAEPILARLCPVDPAAVTLIFLSYIQFATSSPPPCMNELKSSAQDQLEYMLTEDDDAPLLNPDDRIKSEVKKCVSNLLTRFYDLLESLVHGLRELVFKESGIQDLHSLLSDLSWACQILSKMEVMKEFVHSWVEASDRIIRAVEGWSPNGNILETKFKVIEVAVNVLEAIGFGNVILPTLKRLHVVKVWLPFVRITKSSIDSFGFDNEDSPPWFKMDSEIWQNMESALISIVLALPSLNQAEILAEWLRAEEVRYPDLTEAFEVWCYRSKVAKRRMALFSGDLNGVMNSSMPP